MAYSINLKKLIKTFAFLVNSTVSYIKILKDKLFANHKLQNDIGFQIQSKCVALCALREEWNRVICWNAQLFWLEKIQILQFKVPNFFS